MLQWYTNRQYKYPPNALLRGNAKYNASQIYSLVNNELKSSKIELMNTSIITIMCNDQKIESKMMMMMMMIMMMMIMMMKI